MRTALCIFAILAIASVARPADLLPENATIKGPLRVDNDQLVFDDPEASGASATWTLSADLDLSTHAQLQFDLLLEGGIVEVSAEVRGFTSAIPVRRWFFKRFANQGEWDRVRFAFALDDDGAMKRYSGDKRQILLKFYRPPHQPPSAAARVKHVTLTSPPLTLTVDPRQVRNGVHPVVVRNNTARTLDVALGVDPPVATLDRAALHLGPGETQTVRAALDRAKRALLYADVEGQRIIPLRGYRPMYLFAVPPPNDRTWTITPPRNVTLPDSWTYAAPSGVIPRYEDHFRCKTCGFRLSARDFYTYDCHNKKCTQFETPFRVETNDPLVASYLGVYHMHNARLAAKAAFDDPTLALTILTAYADRYVDMPMVAPASTGYRSRITSATLFEKGPLADFTDAYMQVAERGVADDAQLAHIRDHLLTPMLHNVNLHYYGMNAGQVGIITATLKAAIATEQWWYFADALVGDAGLETLLRRGFDDDGIGLEGGAYAASAAERVIAVRTLLRDLDIDFDQQRIEQIRRSSTALGLLKGQTLRESIVLESTGFTVLVAGQGATWRKATINWGRSRERGEHDLLGFDFADNDNLLIHETGRIAYGNPKSKFMTTTLAHNVPIINGRNISGDRKRQLFYHNGDDWAGCIVSGDHLQRSLVLVRGALLVVDRIAQDSDATLDLPIYGGKQVTLHDLPLQPIDKAPHPMIDAARTTVVDVTSFIATWNNGLNAQYVGDPCTVIEADTVMGWTAEPRELLLLRRNASAWSAAVLYSTDPGATLRTDGDRYVLQFDDGATCFVSIDFEDNPRIELRRSPTGDDSSVPSPGS